MVDSAQGSSDQGSYVTVNNIRELPLKSYVSFIGKIYDIVPLSKVRLKDKSEKDRIVLRLVDPLTETIEVILWGQIASARPFRVQ